MGKKRTPATEYGVRFGFEWTQIVDRSIFVFKSVILEGRGRCYLVRLTNGHDRSTLSSRTAEHMPAVVELDIFQERTSGTATKDKREREDIPRGRPPYI